MTHQSPMAKMLFHGGLWVFLGRIVAGMSGMLVSAFLARMLAPEHLAAYFLIFSLLSFLALVAQLGLTKNMVKFVASALETGRPGEARGVMLRALLMVLVAFFAIAVVMLGGGWGFIAHYVAQSPAAAGVGLVSLGWLFALTFQGVVAEIFRGFSAFKKATLFGGVATSLLTLSLVGGVYFSGHRPNLAEVILYVAMATASSLVFALFFIVRKLLSLPPESRPFTMGRILRESAPLWGGSLVMFLVLQADIWILAQVRSQEEVAIYGATTRLVMLISLPLAIVNAVVPPIMARFYVRGQIPELERILRSVATVTGLPILFLGLLALPFAEWILVTIFGARFAAGEIAFQLLCLAQIINVMMGSSGILLVQASKERLLMRITLVTGVVTVLSTYFLGDRYGLNGVALGTGLGVIMQNFLTWLACKRILNINTMSYSPASLPALYARYGHVLGRGSR